MNQKGFTLIEMLIVLLVISILLIITVPNIIQHQKSIRNKGCEAFVKMVQAQVQSYQIDENKLPASLEDLKSKGYIESATCPNGKSLKYDSDGKVSVSE
ncbi:competence type IV pilus major pilin ComGC [Bacillus massiliigorillae]|uniref:competence type IV pilus major pilin ComGC n=1 Tax=Bacillus massiliigorillae TaxID=1243664 RepID=UPI0003A7D3A6|nr:competence type IV pilus major pilin ComGC [Bacillus massiliigorillae]